jgi:2-polyprenyl-6-methoxyphenol hydroxylase-like FAD-dependent oxidoreductase
MSVNTDVSTTGDLIAIQTPALHTPKQWPGFMDRLRASSFTPRTVIKKYDGSLVGTFPLGTPDDPTLVFNRFEFHNILEGYARSLNIPIEFSLNAVAYFESDEKGGVELSDGSKLEADIVVAADGVGSKSWKLILGEKNEPVSSGYALYRVSFPLGPEMENPIIAKEFEGYEDRVSVHVGPDEHVVIGKSKKEICWVLTHKVSCFTCYWRVQGVVLKR